MEDIEQIKQWAISRWTLGEMDACFDADRLDLGRVGITPDPKKMATERGKEMAQLEK